MYRVLKAFITIALILVLVFTLGACAEQGSKEATATPKSTPTPTPDVDPTQEPTPTPTKELVSTVEPGTGKYAEGIKDETKGVLTPFYRASAEQAAEYCNSSMAVQFFTTTTFNAVDVICPTWTKPEGHSIHFTLYCWVGTYYDTIEGEPIADMIFTDYKDGEFNKLEFEEQVDGEYLLYITNDEAWQDCGVWYKKEAHESQVSYLNDAIWEDVSIRMQVHYTKTPNKVYGPLMDPGF